MTAEPRLNGTAAVERANQAQHVEDLQRRCDFYAEQLLAVAYSARTAVQASTPKPGATEAQRLATQAGRLDAAKLALIHIAAAARAALDK